MEARKDLEMKDVDLRVRVGVAASRVTHSAANIRVMAMPSVSARLRLRAIEDAFGDMRILGDALEAWFEELSAETSP